jgi:hypothetical protein
MKNKLYSIIIIAQATIKNSLKLLTEYSKLYISVRKTRYENLFVMTPECEYVKT